MRPWIISDERDRGERYSGLVPRPRVMPTYRIYTFEGGHVREPPKIIECQNDAVKEAKQLLDGKLIEVWEQARCIVRLDPAHR